MKCTVQTDISRQIRTTFRGTSCFPFSLVRAENTVHCAKFLFQRLSLSPGPSLGLQLEGFLIYQWDFKFGANGKKAFPFGMESLRNFSLKTVSALPVNM